ncbi:hypothetical protein ATCC90586_007240 [Pythium insidiosum]|nr:hypothetical protein ATCC90586_007240 [Pythium insidiosum]
MSATTRQASPGPSTRSKAAATTPAPVTPQSATTSSRVTARRIVTDTPTQPGIQAIATLPTRARPERTTARAVQQPPQTASAAQVRKVAGSRRGSARGARKTTGRSAGSAAPATRTKVPSRRGARPTVPPPPGDEPSDDNGDGGDDAADDGVAASDGDGDGDENDQPDGEPDGNGDVDHRLVELSRLPLGGKPNPKSLSLRQFTGKVKPGEFDSGVGLWCQELDSQLVGAQMRDGHRWTEPAKISIMLNLLAEEPAAWLDRLWKDTKALMVKYACQRLREKYATKIGEEAIRDLIRAATRKTSESYEAYAQRLETMANALPGGIEMETNAAATLAAFVRMSCPAHASQLNVEWTLSQRRKTPARTALHEMVE